MTPDLVAVDAGSTVDKEVLSYIREHGQDSETLNVIYVVDDRGKLVDDIRIREFLLKPLEMKVSDLMDENFIALNVTDSQEDAVNVFRKYDRTALPVVDSNGVLVGLVTIDDMLDIAKRKASHRRHSKVWRHGGDGRAVHAHSALADGAQARHLAGGVVHRRDADGIGDGLLRRSNRESGRACAFSSAHYFERRQFRFASFDADHSRDGVGRSDTARLVARNAQGDRRRADARVCARGDRFFARRGLGAVLECLRTALDPLVALTVGIALIRVVLWGSLSGSMLPFVLRGFGADPATSSAPFVATLVDVTGLVIYFNIALLIMRGRDAVAISAASHSY